MARIKTVIMRFRTLLGKLYYFKSFSQFRKCGSNVILSRGGKIIRPDEVTIGSNVFIGRNFHISARNLTIGNNVMIGPNIIIESDDHSYNKVGVLMFDVKDERLLGSIKIEDDTWIGAGAIILKGVRIREGAVVGAGSIVTKDIPPYTICVGSPCKPIKTRFTAEELRIHLKTVNSSIDYLDVLENWKKHNLINLHETIDSKL
jgi:acetyltransferase-like isoleucine patch superfamily enzyme